MSKRRNDLFEYRREAAEPARMERMTVSQFATEPGIRSSLRVQTGRWNRKCGGVL
jgi:hypothetical protein